MVVCDETRIVMRFELFVSVSTARSLLLSSYASTDTRLPLSHRLLWAAANINCDTAALCSIVYWVFLFDHNHSLDVDNISGHILIFLVNIIDTFVSQRYKHKAMLIYIQNINPGPGEFCTCIMSNCFVWCM